MARSTAQVSASVAAIAPWQLWLKWSCEPLLLIAPTLGLKPTAPQKLAGRRIEPTTCVPRPAGTMPAPTAADEPLDEPPGVRLASCGFLVLCHGWLAANSVVVVLPMIIAPASRSACTLAESRCDSWP